MVTEHDIITLIQNEVMNDKAELQGDTPLFSEGLLDSMQLTSLFLSLENAYKVSVGVFDVSLENFDTPALIAAWVNGKLSVA